MLSPSSVQARAVRWLVRQAQKRLPHSDVNPFLEAAFAPVREERTETVLRIEGHIPPDLNGTLLRIGPNPMHVDNPGAYHWFVGDGMVHGLCLREGRALWYRNRWIGSDSVRQQQGRPRAAGWRRGASDVVNTNVIGHGGKLWALVEAGAFPVELDGHLETLSHGYFGARLDLPFTAHPHLDPHTGELHAVCYDPLNRRRVRYVVVGGDCQLRRVVDIPVKHGPMMHDSAITATHVVVLDLPVTFSIRELLAGAGLPYRWHPQHHSRVGLLPRNGMGSDIRWCEVAPCFVYHTCNAYELADGCVVLYAAVHDQSFAGSRMGPDGTRMAFERWTIDPMRAKVVRETVSGRPQEFPRYDERYAMRPFRYAYTLGMAEPGHRLQASRLLRHDLVAGVTQERDFGAASSISEAIFVPASITAAEAEGWLLLYVTDIARDRSELHVLDAANLGRAPLAIVHLPCRVPAGFHGNWIAQPQ